MNKLKFKYAIGLIAAAFIMVANLQYAFSEYGIPFASTLHINVLAQTSNGSGNSSTGGSSSGSNSSSSGTDNGESSNGGNFCPDYNYVPNRYITSVPSESSRKSNSKGELEINGILKSGFSKNTEYPVTLDTKNCDGEQDFSCCDQRNVGTFVVKVN